jgi:hypothetical protein
MTFELFCMTLIALGFGLLMIFGGYRLFLIILPIWGFFFGFGLGVQTLTYLFGYGFLSTVTSWIVGFFVGALFGLLSYLFYTFAIALLSGSLGYGLMVGILTAIGLNPGFITWILGIIAGVALALVVLYFNIQKYAVIAITAIAGTSVIIFALMATFGGIAINDLLNAPLRQAMQGSLWWWLFFFVVAGAGIFIQIRETHNYEIAAYNRLEG